jgi:hypothetical protein
MEMKVAILLCGHVRSWDKCKESFLNAFKDTDIFVHTYNTVLNYHPYISQTENIINNKSTLSTPEIVELIGLDIKKIVVEDDNNIFIPSDKIIYDDVYCQYRKNFLCNNLRLDYEKENNIQYDLIIKTRFDIVYSVGLDYILNFIDDIKTHNYISSGPSIYPSDQVFICSSENMNILCNSLLDIKPEDNNFINTSFGPHEWVLKKIKNIKQLPGLNTGIIRTSN